MQTSPDTSTTPVTQSCILCKMRKLDVVLDLGRQPVANGLLSSQRGAAQTFPLRLAKCRYCNHVQLADHVPPNALFGSYVYRTGISATMRAHFGSPAGKIAKLHPGGKVFDIGSNDGTLLNALRVRGMRVQGVDPSSVAAGVPNTHSGYFTEHLAKQFVEEGGHADVVVVANCLAHTPTPSSMLDAAYCVLKTGGSIVVEAPYIYNTVDVLGYDQIYHEHYSYFSAGSINKLLDDSGFVVTAVDMLPVHGGSIRVWAKKRDAADKTLHTSNEWLALLTKELWSPIDWDKFSRRVREHKLHLVEKCAGVALGGLCAPAKATVLTNYTGINPLIVYDQTPDKIGGWIPQACGSHIPISKWEDLGKYDMDLYILFAWNFVDEIVSKLPQLKGKILVPMPTMRTV